MEIVNLQNKYVPIKNYKIYTATMNPKVDPDTMQPIGDVLSYQYKFIIDNFNNVYMLPMKDGKTMFSLSDIVESASGNKEKINKIQDVRNYLMDTYCADLLGQEWKDYLYKDLINGNSNKTSKAELEEDTKQRLNEDILLPDYVSSYEDLSHKPDQITALIKSARTPENLIMKSPSKKVKN